MKVALVGAGVCGMFTAMALARRGHEITILDRDDPPPEGDADAAFFDWQRTGAAQFRHPHAFLGLMCSLIETHYPELLEALYAAGARRVDFAEMLRPELKARYDAEPAEVRAGDEKMWVLLCRRATIETVVRRHVELLENVEIRTGLRVTGLETRTDNGLLWATGVTFDDPATGAQTLRADLVIDASGRTSHFPRWLRDLGQTVREEKHDAEIVYYTRHYQLAPGQAEPERDGRAGAGDLGYLKYGVFPGDNGHFAIILCVPMAETALRKAVRDSATFDRICLNIPGLEPWLADGRSTGTTDAFGIGDIQSVWRHYTDEAGNPFILDFFAVGDAALRTNPLYGRGCSTSILHAEILGAVLEDTTDPFERAVCFAERTEDELRPIHAASLREDRNGIRRSAAVLTGQPLNRAKSLRAWLRLAFGDALSAASREQLHVLRGAMRSFHLLEKPGEFLKDRAIQRTVVRYMLRGRRRNAATRLQPGPDRQTMHERIGIQPVAPDAG